MNNNGQYTNAEPTVGDIWNFPSSWGHTIQAVDPNIGCKMILFFDYPMKPTMNDLGISGIMTAFPIDVISENLGGIPEDIIKTWPKESTPLQQGTMPPPPLAKSRNPIPNPPLTSVYDGFCDDAGVGGYLLGVRKENFPGATTMSGGFMHMTANTMRDIHWHPDADEMQYVLNGTLKVTVYGTPTGENIYNSYKLEAGDVGFVPKGFAHYFESVDSEVDLLLTFNSPSWQTQELSTWLAVTPSYLTAASLATDVENVDKYFPKAEEEFIGGDFSGCPAGTRRSWN